MTRPPRAVVFDLDGTLADTADLAQGHRSADLVLSGPIDPTAGTPAHPLALGPMPTLPGRLRHANVPTVVITRSPAAYASTVLGLIGCGELPLFASGPPRAAKLVSIAEQSGWDPPEVLYVADTAEDAAEAERAGVQFLHVDDARGRIPPALPGTDLPDITGPPGRWLHLLRQHPGRFDPHQVDHALANGLTPAHRHCLIDRFCRNGNTTIGLRGWLTLRHRDRDAMHRHLRILAALLPTRRRRLGHFPVDYIVPYSSALTTRDPLGRLMSDIKDFRVHRSGESPRSGPAVRFAALPFIAEVLAAHTDAPVVATPCGPFTARQPGRAAAWLAAMTAHRSGHVQLDTDVTYPVPRPHDMDLLAPNPGGPVVIDDQITDGDTITAFLHATRHRPARAMTWSSSNVPATQMLRPGQACQWPEGDTCPVHTETAPAHSGDELIRALLGVAPAASMLGVT